MLKKDFEILLSLLQGFVRPKEKLEQYSTPSFLAADLLWDAHQKGYIKGKRVVDLGCGTGILGIGALFLGAKSVSFVDIDRDALDLAKQNVSFLEKRLGKKFVASFSCLSVSSFSGKAEVVFQNPPFGTKDEHADRIFLEKALHTAPLVYSFHKFSTRKFIEEFVRQHNFHVVEVYRYKFPLKAQFSFHVSRVRDVDVGVWCLQKD